MFMLFLLNSARYIKIIPAFMFYIKQELIRVVKPEDTNHTYVFRNLTFCVNEILGHLNHLWG